jgi:hypothetical protein
MLPDRTLYLLWGPSNRISLSLKNSAPEEFHTPPNLILHWLHTIRRDQYPSIRAIHFLDSFEFGLGASYLASYRLPTATDFNRQFKRMVWHCF